MRTGALVLLLAIIGACSGNKTGSGTSTTEGEPSRETKDAGAEEQANESPEAAAQPLPCASFKRLPTYSFSTNTVIDDDCLAIPANQEIKVGQDVHVIIIATRKLRIGDSVVIAGKGIIGDQGGRSDVDIEEWRPSAPDQSEKIHCACKGTHCKDGWGGCSAANKPHLEGKQGGQGRPGARIDIVAREVIIGTSTKIDVSGGDGGPPGASGRVECMWGGIQCSAVAQQRSHGPVGTPGVASYKAGTVSADASLSKLVGATTPATSASRQIIDTNASLRRAFREARDAGKTYDNLSGVP